MPSVKPRFTITISEKLDNRITKFWHENELGSKNEAIKQLLDIGLKSLESGQVVYTPSEKRPDEYEPSEDGLKVAKRFDRLDDDYQRFAMTLMQALSKEQRQRAGNQDEVEPE